MQVWEKERKLGASDEMLGKRLRTVSPCTPVPELIIRVNVFGIFDFSFCPELENSLFSLANLKIRIFTS